MSEYQLNEFTVKFMRTPNNNWFASFSRDEMKEFALKSLMTIGIKELAGLIKEWKNHETVGEFYTAAALEYYPEMDRVRNYLGKKGNMYVNQVKEKYLSAPLAATFKDKKKIVP